MSNSRRLLLAVLILVLGDICFTAARHLESASNLETRYGRDTGVRKRRQILLDEDEGVDTEVDAAAEAVGTAVKEDLEDTEGNGEEEDVNVGNLAADRVAQGEKPEKSGGKKVSVEDIDMLIEKMNKLNDGFAKMIETWDKFTLQKEGSKKKKDGEKGMKEKGKEKEPKREEEDEGKEDSKPKKKKMEEGEDKPMKKEKESSKEGEKTKKKEKI